MNVKNILEKVDKRKVIKTIGTACTIGGMIISHVMSKSEMDESVKNYFEKKRKEEEETN